MIHSLELRSQDSVHIIDGNYYFEFNGISMNGNMYLKIKKIHMFDNKNLSNYYYFKFDDLSKMNAISTSKHERNTLFVNNGKITHEYENEIYTIMNGNLYNMKISILDDKFNVIHDNMSFLIEAIVSQ